MWKALASLAGLVLVAATLRDAWCAVLRPGAAGQLGPAVSRSFWRLAGALAPRRPGARALAGPLALTAVLASWAVGLAVGFALLLGSVRPAPPAGAAGGAAWFAFEGVWSPGAVAPPPSAHVASLVEGILALALAVAATSIVLTTRAVLARRGSLARDVSALLHALEARSGASAGLRSSALCRIAERIAGAATDLRQSPLTYWFHDADDGGALEAVLPALADLAVAARRRPPLRLGADRLDAALAGLAAVLRDGFVGGPRDPDDVLEAYARDHGRTPRRFVLLAPGVPPPRAVPYPARPGDGRVGHPGDGRAGVP